MRPYKRTYQAGKDFLAEYDCTDASWLFDWGQTNFRMYNELVNAGFDYSGDACDCLACLEYRKYVDHTDPYRLPPWERIRRHQLQTVAGLIERRTLTAHWQLNQYEHWVPKRLRCLTAPRRI